MLIGMSLQLCGVCWPTSLSLVAVRHFTAGRDYFYVAFSNIQSLNVHLSLLIAERTYPIRGATTSLCTLVFPSRSGHNLLPTHRADVKRLYAERQGTHVNAGMEVELQGSAAVEPQLVRCSAKTILPTTLRHVCHPTCHITRSGAGLINLRVARDPTDMYTWSVGWGTVRWTCSRQNMSATSLTGVN